jgi:hypothetical protein
LEISVDIRVISEICSNIRRICAGGQGQSFPVSMDTSGMEGGLDDNLGKGHYDRYFDNIGSEQRGERNEFTFQKAMPEEKKSSSEDVWNGLQAVELDVVVEGDNEMKELTTTSKPPSTNKSAALRKGRVIRMGSATL